MLKTLVSRAIRSADRGSASQLRLRAKLSSVTKKRVTPCAALARTIASTSSARAIARLAPLDVDDGAEAALERAAASGVEAGIVPRPRLATTSARQQRDRRRGHVGHVVEVIVDRLGVPGCHVAQELRACRPSAFACVEDHAELLRLLQVRAAVRAAWRGSRETWKPPIATVTQLRPSATPPPRRRGRTVGESPRLRLRRPPDPLASVFAMDMTVSTERPR